MIAQVQTDAASRPIITSLTTQPACQKSAQIESCPGTSAIVSIPETCLSDSALRRILAEDFYIALMRIIAGKLSEGASSKAVLPTRRPASPVKIWSKEGASLLPRFPAHPVMNDYG